MCLGVVGRGSLGFAPWLDHLWQVSQVKLNEEWENNTILVAKHEHI